MQFSVYKHWCYKETIGSSSFNTFAQSPISESRNVLDNITAVTTVHHALNQEKSKIFDDNGEGDEYPDDIENTGIFWGKSNEREIGVNELDCGEGSVGVQKCWDYYVFWIRVVKDKCADPECI